MGIPGEKFLGKDKEGWEYTSHDLWRKKMIWKPEYKKVWRVEKKQEWVRRILALDFDAISLLDRIISLIFFKKIFLGT